MLTKSNTILVTPQQIREMVKEQGCEIKLTTCEKILDWCYDLEFRVAIIDSNIVMEDLQTEDTILFNESMNGIIGFLNWWSDTWKDKYNYSLNSIDRRICGDIFINDILEMIKEIEEIKNNI